MPRPSASGSLAMIAQYLSIASHIPLFCHPEELILLSLLWLVSSKIMEETTFLIHRSLDHFVRTILPFAVQEFDECWNSYMQ